MLNRSTVFAMALVFAGGLLGSGAATGRIHSICFAQAADPEQLGPADQPRPTLAVRARVAEHNQRVEVDSEQAGKKPNIVLILADNLGYGELGCYGGGITRGAPTPRLDRLASEGTRLCNFNVEPSCTPSRSALLTGRHPIRSGTYSVPIDGRPYGLVQWEVTLAELLSAQGYATAHYGKWHLGDSEGRYPTDQGFDEWYGIPNSSDEAMWAQHKDFDPKVAHLEHLMEGRKGEQSRKLKVYDLVERRKIDTELAARTIDFMKRSTQADRPFFAYVPITQPHMPTEAGKAFVGKTGHGPFADVLAEMDANVGRILDAVSELRISENTIVIFTSDNGPEDTLPWRGWAGPWSGTYVTAMEGSLRVPFIIRWPGKIPAGRVSNEMLHETDVYTTLAKLGGADIPTDRAIDGIDQREFLLGRQEKSAREFIPIFQGRELYAMKWRNYKMHFVWQERMHDVPQKLAVPRLIDLYANPQETIQETIGESSVVTRGWVLHAMFAQLAKLKATVAKDPLIPMGSPDPYVQPTAGVSNPPLELPVPPPAD
jgi:arylsulfatase A-like enzyme